MKGIKCAVQHPDTKKIHASNWFTSHWSNLVSNFNQESERLGSRREKVLKIMLQNFLYK